MILRTSKAVTVWNRNSSSWNMVLAEGALYAGRALTEASLLDSAAVLAPTRGKELVEPVGQFRHIPQIHRSRFLFRRDTVSYHLPHGTATAALLQSRTYLD